MLYILIKNIIHCSLSDFLVSSGFTIFWTLRLLRTMINLRIVRNKGQIVRHIPIYYYYYYYYYYTNDLMTFNSWFHRRWRNIYRKWVGDPTIYIVEYLTKCRKLKWFLCWNLWTISGSQNETYGRGCYWPSWLHSLPAGSWRVPTLVYWM